MGRRGALVRGGLALVIGLLATGAARAEQTIDFPSLDPGVELTAQWFPVATGTPAGAVVLLHHCGGMRGPRGGLNARLGDYAALVNAAGLHALVVDSFGPRGETEVCTQRAATRRITQAHRRGDALAALAWLARRPDVDAQRLGLLGWSHGASTVLAATNLRVREVAGAAARPAFAVAFYPSCEAELRRGYRAGAPLLLLLGEADDWTPAAPCQELALRAEGTPPQVETYPGAHHAFDAHGPVRLLRNIPGGANPGQGVHVGGDPEALRRSRARLLGFLGTLPASSPAPSSAASPPRPPPTTAAP